MEDRTAKQTREAEEQLARVRQDAKLDEEEERAERSSHTDNLDQILGVLSAGISLTQQASIAQRSRMHATSPPPIAQRGQHKTQHYTPPPRAQIATTPRPYHVIPTPTPPAPAPRQCIQYRQPGCSTTPDCCEGGNGVVCALMNDGVSRCCAPAGTPARHELVFCCNGTVGTGNDKRCK